MRKWKQSKYTVVVRCITDLIEFSIDCNNWFDMLYKRIKLSNDNRIVFVVRH